MRNHSVLQAFCKVALLSTFMVSISCGAAEVRKSSTINVSGNGRYFVDQNGKPLFWQADTEWELFHLFTAQDAETMLQNPRDSTSFRS
jgi:uncharacterized pyridoxamine 5'-phosphate oxidase family protein